MNPPSLFVMSDSIEGVSGLSKQEFRDSSNSNGSKVYSKYKSRDKIGLCTFPDPSSIDVERYEAVAGLLRVIICFSSLKLSEIDTKVVTPSTNLYSRTKLYFL